MRVLALILLVFSCLFAGVAEKLNGMGFSNVRVLSRIPVQIQGPLIVVIEGTNAEPRVIHFGNSIGRVDSTSITYLGDKYPVTNIAAGYLNGDFYEILVTEKFMMIFSNVPRGAGGSLFMQIIMNSGRSNKYIIQ